MRLIMVSTVELLGWLNMLMAFKMLISSVLALKYSIWMLVITVFNSQWFFFFFCLRGIKETTRGKELHVLCMKDEVNKEGEHCKPSEKYVLRHGCLRNYK